MAGYGQRWLAMARNGWHWLAMTLCRTFSFFFLLKKQKWISRHDSTWIWCVDGRPSAWWASIKVHTTRFLGPPLCPLCSGPAAAPAASGDVSAALSTSTGLSAGSNAASDWAAAASWGFSRWETKTRGETVWDLALPWRTRSAISEKRCCGAWTVLFGKMRNCLKTKINGFAKKWNCLKTKIMYYLSFS